MKKVAAVVVMVMVAGLAQAATVSNALEVARELWGTDGYNLVSQEQTVRDSLVRTLNVFEASRIDEQDWKDLLTGTWPTNNLTMRDAVRLTSGGKTEAMDPPPTFRKRTITGALNHVAALVYAVYDKTSMAWAVTSHNARKNRAGLKSLFGGNAQALVRRKLRDEGKPIVTVGGTNPVAVTMAPVIDAANAPMLQGLEAAVSNAMGETVSVDRSVQAEYEALRDSAWVGDVVVDVGVQEKLIFLMGVSNYNAWVEAFNAQ